jgi:hypothetical protein
LTLVDKFDSDQDPDWAFGEFNMAGAGPDQVLAEIFQLVEHMNSELKDKTLDAGLIEKLRKWLAKMGDELKKLGSELGAASYSLSMGVPGGVSISLTFARS